jgi:hypothetical protein
VRQEARRSDDEEVLRRVKADIVVEDHRVSWRTHLAMRTTMRTLAMGSEDMTVSART